MNTDMARLRTKLREINIAHSTLVRREADQDRPVRLAELRRERRALMTIIAACGNTRQRCVPHCTPYLFRSTCCEAGKWFAIRAPTRSDSDHFVRLCRSSRPSAAADVLRAVATSDAFDSPQRSEDYRDVFEKPALPRALAPQLVGARKTRRPYSADYVLRGSPTQCRQPRTRKPRREVRRPTMVSEGRGRQPVYCLPRTRGKDGWRHWVGL